MGVRGELFTTEVYLDNRSYFFNVKENRTGDVFLQIVESKSRDGADGERHQIAIFADDMQKFLQGMDRSLNFVEKDRKERAKIKAAKKAEKAKERRAKKKAEKMLDNEQNYDIIMVLRATRKKKDKKLIVTFLNNMYPTENMSRKTDVSLLEYMSELQMYYQKYNR